MFVKGTYQLTVGALNAHFIESTQNLITVYKNRCWKYAHLCLTFPLSTTKLPKRFNYFSSKLSGSFIKGQYYPQNYCVFNYLFPSITQFLFLACFHIFLIINYLDGYYLSLYCTSLNNTYFDFVNKHSFRYILSFKMGRRRDLVYKGVLVESQ